MKFKLIVFIIAFSLKAQAQDSLVSPVIKKNELGISVLAPFIFLSGGTNYTERFSYITYRRRVKQKHALKVFIAFPFLNENNNQYIQTTLPSTGSITLHPTHEIRTPCNIEIGLGYELILGKQKLKHVLGLDAVYNNKFVEDEYYVLSSKDTVDANGYNRNIIDRLDSGAYSKGTQYNKFGANLSYGIRYEFSKKWLITSSFIASFRYNSFTTSGSRVSNFDVNVAGLISDISVFYRF